jgi:tripartite-type tricarboxylate transporter receptor subunit TctC
MGVRGLLSSFLSFLAALFATACLSAVVRADEYPNNKIRILVPTAAGGVADTLSRIIAAKVQDTIGQTVYVEDRPGANGNLGASVVLSSPADAYTVMMGHIGLMTVNYHLYSKMEFNPIEAFVPIIHVVSYPDVLIVNNKLPVKTYAEFIKYAKESPKALTYSSSGFGSSFHMAMELLKARAGFDAVHVPYTGTAPALNALLSSAVDVTFSDVITAAPQIETGNVRVLAVSGRHRVKSMPNVPTIEEAGLPGFVVVGWAGLVAKAGTPPARIKLINEHVNRALQAQDVVERVAALGAEVVGGTPDAFGKFMQDEDKKWGDLAKRADLRIKEK